MVEGVEGGGSPDAESADMSAWGEFQQVEFVNWEKSDTGDVAEGKSDTIVLAVDDKWTTLLNVTSVSHLTTTGTVTAAGLDTLNISPGVCFSQNGDGVLGLLQ